MPLCDFGEKYDSEDNDRKSLPRPPTQVFDDLTEDLDVSNPDILSCIQWTYVGKNILVPCTNTEKILRPGCYELQTSQQGQVLFKRKEIKTDTLIDFPDSLSQKILDEIDVFWGTYDQFKKYGTLHRRGYLFYGPPGSGKTCLVKQICNQIINKGDVIFDCKNPSVLLKGLENFREVEPDRKIVCIFEDLDAIIRDYGEDRLLSILDGENLVDRVLNIATTNYPEVLDKRLVGRPRRFDRLYEIVMPSKEQRRIFFDNKLLPEDKKKESLEKWVDETEGFSFAALTDLIVSVLCLGNSFDEIIKILSKLIFSKVSSSDYNKNKTGF